MAKLLAHLTPANLLTVLLIVVGILQNSGAVGTVAVPAPPAPVVVSAPVLPCPSPAQLLDAGTP